MWQEKHLGDFTQRLLGVSLQVNPAYFCTREMVNPACRETAWWLVLQEALSLQGTQLPTGDGLHVTESQTLRAQIPSQPEAWKQKSAVAHLYFVSPDPARSTVSLIHLAESCLKDTLGLSRVGGLGHKQSTSTLLPFHSAPW